MFVHLWIFVDFYLQKHCETDLLSGECVLLICIFFPVNFPFFFFFFEERLGNLCF
jgi:hypothetical protein